MPFTFKLSMRLALMKAAAAVAACSLQDLRVIDPTPPSPFAVMLASHRERQLLAFDRTRLTRKRVQGGSV
jgi:hypothetical protein